MTRTITIAEERFGRTRLDKILAESFSDLSRSYFQKLIRDGKVTVNGLVETSPKFSPRIGDVLSVALPEPADKSILPEKIPFECLYEDADILVISKPAGLSVHPANACRSGTLVNALLGLDPEFAEKMEDPERPGIVHRLDKDTSGCLVIAKTPTAKFALSRQFAQREVSKTYLAVSYGWPPSSSGELRTLIGRHPLDRKRMAVLKDSGRMAVSSYRLLSKGILEGKKAAVLEVKIMTGRTHQIRVHLAHLKCPVLGDRIYGGRQELTSSRLLLHAWKLGFCHPRTGEALSFESQIPEEISQMLNIFSR